MPYSEEDNIRWKLRNCACGNDRYARRFCVDCEKLLERLDEIQQNYKVTDTEVYPPEDGLEHESIE